MNTVADPGSRRRRLRFGFVAVLASATISIMIATGVAAPYPNLRFAYFLCVAVGVAGLIHLIIALAVSPPDKPTERLGGG